jgi:TP901 family phage tail tape measure protein
MANQQLTLRMNVTADTKQAQAEFAKLQASLSMLMQQGSRGDIGRNWSAGMQSAVQSAKELQIHLNKAFNQKTGQLELDRLNMSLQSSGKSITQYSQALLQGGQLGQAAFRNLSTQIMSTQAPTARLTGMVAELAGTFKTALKYQISYGAINAVTNGIREAVNYAKDLNGTLNDIRIVTGKSADEADRLARNAQKAAKNLSTSANDLLQAQLIYFQQGDSEAMASMKGEITTKAAKVAGVEAQQMSEYLTAVWNSYKVGSGELELFVDKLAAVGAATATSLEEISTAMTKVAATANTVGVSYDQLTATIATISSVTRTSAESVGTAMKTIYARMGDLKLGKEDEDGMQLGAVSSQLKQVGVDILDAKGNLRDMGVVVEEVGEKWQGWTEAQRAAVAQAIAGKRQYTQLMALFENWDMYTETKGVSEGASGALEDQFKIWSDSWEAASERVQVATEGMYSKLFNDDAMIAFTDGLAYLTTTVGTLLDGLGGIPGILMLIMSYLMKVKGVAIAEYFMEIGRNIKLAFGGEALSATSALKAELASINVTGIKGLSTETLNYINRLKMLEPIQKQVDSAMRNMTGTQKAEVQSLIEISNVLGEVADKYQNTADAANRSSRITIGKALSNKKKGEAGYAVHKDKVDQSVNAVAQNTEIKHLTDQVLGGVDIGQQLSRDKAGTNLTKYGNAVKELTGDIDKLGQINDFAKKHIGDTDAYKKFTQSFEQGKVSMEDIDGVMQELNGVMQKNTEIVDNNVNKMSNNEKARKTIKTAILEEGKATGEANIAHDKHKRSLEEIGKKCEQVSTKINSFGSALMGIGMAMSMTSNMVETIKNNIKDGKTSVEDVSSIIISFSMILTMTLAPAVMAVRKAMKTGEGLFGSWLSLIIALVAIIGTIVVKTADWRSDEEKLNDSLKETEERINELKNSTREYESVIEELRKKQKTANAAEYAELEREIRLKEQLRDLNKEALEIEEKREKELQKEKVDKWLAEQREKKEYGGFEVGGIRYKVTYQGSSSQLGKELSAEQYAALTLEQKKEIVKKANKGPGHAYEIDLTKYENLSLPNTSSTGKLYFTKENILPEEYTDTLEKLNKAEEKLEKARKEGIQTQDQYNAVEQETLNLQKERIKYLQELAQYITYGEDVGRKEVAKNLKMLNDENKDDKLSETETYSYLADLYKVDPEAFKSLETFKEVYKDLIPPEVLKLVDKFWKDFQVNAKNAAREAQNVTKTTENFVKSIDAVRDAQEEIKENKGWLNNSTIEEVIRSMSGLGDAVGEYRQKLYEANGDAEELKRIMTEMTQEDIAGRLIKGEFNNMTEKQIEAILREANVTDAATYAKKLYVQSHKQAILETKDLTPELLNNADAMAKLAAETGLTETAIVHYYIQEKIINNSSLNLSDKAKEFNKIAAAAMSASVQVSGLSYAMSAIGGILNLETRSGLQKITGADILNETDRTKEYKFSAGQIRALGLEDVAELYQEKGFVTGKTREWGFKITAGAIQDRARQLIEEGQEAAANALLEQANNMLDGLGLGDDNKGGGGNKEKTLKEKLDEGLDELVSGYENRTKRNVTRLVKEIGEDGKEVLVEKVFDDIPTPVDVQEYIKKMISSGEYTPSKIDDLWDQLDEIWDSVIENEKKQAQLIEDAADGATDLAALETEYAKALDNVNLAKEHIAQSLANSSQNRPYTREQELEDIENTLADYNKANKILEEEIKEIEAEGEAYIKAANFEAYTGGHSGEVAARESILAKTEQRKFQQMQNKLAAYDWLVELGKASEEDRADYAKSLEDEYFDWLRSEELEIAKLKRDLIKEAADYEFKQWKEEKEREKAELDAKASILEKSFSTTNSITEAQHELNKELQKSLTMYQYLDEDTRKLLFNTEDYVALSSELADIQKEVDKVTASYLMNIQGKTAEQIEDLTKQYERQTETLMKQYEIKKAEFEIEKKRLELNNTLNERNTRMFVNGQWTWVADANAVAQAQEQLADAEYQKSKLETEAAQKASLDAINGQSDALSLQIKEVEKSFKDFKDALDGKDKGLVQAIKEAGDNIDAYSKSLIQKITGITGVDYAKKSTDTFDPLGNFSKMQNTSYNMSDGTTVKSVAGGTAIYDSSGRFISFVKKNAAGTDNAQGGISSVNEKGIEMWATKYGHMVELNPGDKIFNHDQFDFLYRFSKNPTEALRNINNNSAQAIDNRITIGGIEVAGNSEEGEALRSILTRLIGNR